MHADNNVPHDRAALTGPHVFVGAGRRSARALYQTPKRLTHEAVFIVMAGESLPRAKAGGPPSTSLLITAGKDVDADLRRHDDSPPPEGHRQGRLV